MSSALFPSLYIDTPCLSQIATQHKDTHLNDSYDAQVSYNACQYVVVVVSVHPDVYYLLQNIEGKIVISFNVFWNKPN